MIACRRTALQVLASFGNREAKEDVVAVLKVPIVDATGVDDRVSFEGALVAAIR